MSDVFEHAAGWNSTTDSVAIYFYDYAAPESSPAQSGKRNGRVISSQSGARIRVSQALTLCPGTSYDFSAYSRQERTSSECSAEFVIGGQSLFLAEPGTSWEFGSEQYTLTGSDAEAASVDLDIIFVCIGSGDDDGNRVIDIDDVSLTPVENP